MLERLGDSRLGEVFRARDTRVGRTVALVVASDAFQAISTAAKLRADAQTVMTVSHPNIAALYEIGEEGGRLFLAFEFVPGEELDRVIAGHPLNARRAIDLATQIADALAEAHAAGVVHGELTTSKVVVTPKGNAKLVDLGLTAWTAAATDPNAHHATDVTALGAVLFEMLTGRSRTDASIAPTMLNASLPGEVDALAAKTFDSAVVFAAELRALGAILDVRAEQLVKSRPAPIGRHRSRSKAPIIATSVLIALVAAFVTWWLLR